MSDAALGSLNADGTTSEASKGGVKVGGIFPNSNNSPYTRDP